MGVKPAPGWLQPLLSLPAPISQLKERKARREKFVSLKQFWFCCFFWGFFFLFNPRRDYQLCLQGKLSSPIQHFALLRQLRGREKWRILLLVGFLFAQQTRQSCTAAGLRFLPLLTWMCDIWYVIIRVNLGFVSYKMVIEIKK